jgi:tetratricopeptide (TPR) repeat protein
VASLQNRQQDAIKFYEAAGNYRARVGDYLGEAQTNANLGDAYLAVGRDRNAIGAYRLALRLGRDEADTGIQFRALDGLIQVYSDRRDWTQAQAYLEQRLALTNTLEDDWQQLLSWRQLGDFYRITGNPSAAQAAYQQALTLARRLQQKQLEGELTNRLIELARVVGD